VNRGGGKWGRLRGRLAGGLRVCLGAVTFGRRSLGQRTRRIGRTRPGASRSAVEAVRKSGFSAHRSNSAFAARELPWRIQEATLKLHPGWSHSGERAGAGEGQGRFFRRAGSWFGQVHRDGRLSVPLKGNLWTGPFHLPRMQWCWRLVEELERETSGPSDPLPRS
jgi:hypothetical protein